MKVTASKQLPLEGKRVLVTRARRQAGALSRALRKLGAKVVEVPAIEIRSPRSFRPLDRVLSQFASYDWLILTSVNGVDALLARMNRLSIPLRQLSGMRIAAIGPATRTALENRGLRVDVMPREYVAEAVVRALRRRVRGQRILLVRAAVARDVIPKQLQKAGARVDVVAAYRTVAPKGSASRLRLLLKSPRRPDFITFTSSSTARNFAAMLKGNSLTGTKLVSIGPVTSSTLRQVGLRADIEASSYTMAGLMKAMVRSA